MSNRFEDDLDNDRRRRRDRSEEDSYDDRDDRDFRRPIRRKSRAIHWIVLGSSLGLVVIAIVVFAVSRSSRKPGSPSEAPHAQALEKANTGDVEVEIVGMGVGGPRPIGDFDSPCTVIYIVLRNQSKTKVARFNGWQGNAEMKDEHGNRFGPVDPKSVDSHADDYLLLQPMESVSTKVFFEQVPFSSKEVVFSAPASKLEGSGTLSFKLTVFESRARLALYHQSKWVERNTRWLDESPTSALPELQAQLRSIEKKFPGTWAAKQAAESWKRCAEELEKAKKQKRP